MATWYDPEMLDLAELAPDVPRPLYRLEFERLCELGVFDDERVELLEGVIVRMAPTSPPHDDTIARLTRLLVLALGDRAWVRVNASYAASDISEPLPDLCVAPPGDYSKAHPTQPLLVIEVAHSSLRKDRGAKYRLYSGCGVQDYWIVNLDDRTIEVYRSPTGQSYRDVTIYDLGQELRLLAFPDVVVRVNDVIA
jgi:Uma2 family endonuclease